MRISADGAVTPSGAGNVGEAFISYARTESVALAVALQTAIERFAKPWYRVRAVRVFRDDTNMAANPDLRGTIETALSRASWFILLASPQAARSPWVEYEVGRWLANRPADRIMIVQAAGEIAWDPRRNQFDLDRSDAIPPILGAAYQAEPRWIDMRWFSQPDSSGVADSRFPERVADLAAPIHGRERADLVGENIRQHRRALRLAQGAGTALVILLILSIVATVLALGQRQEATRQRDAAVRQNVVSVARQLAATAVNLTTSDMQQASLVAVQAYRLHPDAQTASALYTTAAASPQLVGFLDAGAAVTATAGTPDASVVVAGTQSGDVWRWNRVTGARDHLFTLDRPVTRLCVSDRGDVVTGYAGPLGSDEATSVPPSSDIWRNGRTDTLDYAVQAMSPSGELLADALAPTDDGPVTVRVHRGADILTTVELPDPLLFAEGVQLPDEDRLVTVYGSGVLSTFDLPSGREIIHGVARTGAHPFVSAIDPKARFVTVSNGAKDVEIDAIADPIAPDDESEIAGYGRTETSVPSDIALSPGAKQLATDVDGRIWVGPVAEGAKGKPRAPTVLLGSGTARPGTLRFLGQRFLISGAGSAVSIWDLARDSRLGTRIPITLTPTCNACGPGSVLLNPSGTRALVYNYGHDGAVLADFSTDTSVYAAYSGGRLANLAGRQAVWLDDDHLFTWDDTAGVATVWTGETLQDEVAHWTVPDQSRSTTSDGPSQVLLTASGGRVLLIDSAGRVLDFDVAGRAAQQRPKLTFPDHAVIGLDATATRAWALTTDDEDTSHPRSRLQVLDVATGKVTADRMLDGAFDHAGFHGTTLQLWGDLVTPLTTLDLASGVVVTGRSHPLGGSAVAAEQPFVVFDEAGTVSLLDTDLGAIVGTFPIPTEAYATTIFGFADHDQIMAVATEASDEDGAATVRTVRLGYQQWQAIDCGVAGRDLTPTEWQSLTDLAVPGDLRCRR